MARRSKLAIAFDRYTGREYEVSCSSCGHLDSQEKEGIATRVASAHRDRHPDHNTTVTAPE